MRRLAILSCVLLLSGSALLLGCGGDDPAQADAGTQPDAARQVDGAPQTDAAPPADAAPGDGGAGCSASSNYGDLGTRTDSVEADDLTTPTIVWATLDLNADPDTLKVDLYQGVGVFIDSIHTGTFQLTGDELSYETCALCVHLTTAGPGGAQDYMATGGTVTVTAVAPKLQATLTNVTFEHVTIDNAVSTPVGDGCVSGFANLVLDSPLKL